MVNGGRIAFSRPRAIVMIHMFYFAIVTAQYIYRYIYSMRTGRLLSFKRPPQPRAARRTPLRMGMRHGVA